MKKKHKRSLPQVHIQGDLKDVQHLISAFLKKKSLLIFKPVDTGTCYLEIEGKLELIKPKQLKKLEDKFKCIYITFSPVQKAIEIQAEVIEVPVEEPKTVKPVVLPEKLQKVKKVKSEKSKKDD